jgi:hypothetical protein
MGLTLSDREISKANASSAPRATKAAAARRASISKAQTLSDKKDEGGGSTDHLSSSYTSTRAVDMTGSHVHLEAGLHPREGNAGVAQPQRPPQRQKRNRWRPWCVLSGADASFSWWFGFDQHIPCCIPRSRERINTRHAGDPYRS